MAVRVASSADQTVAGGGAFTVGIDTAVFDTGTPTPFFDPLSGDPSIEIPVDGIYYIQGQARFEGAEGSLINDVVLNLISAGGGGGGPVGIIGQAQTGDNLGSPGITVQVDCIIELVAGQDVSLEGIVTTNGGDAVITQNDFFSAMLSAHLIQRT